jgi:predicted DNA-binding transcriptional regulator AlpA
MPAIQPVFLSAAQVRERYGVSFMWIERRLADHPDFPRPLYIGRRRFWKLASLEAWERKLAAQDTTRTASVSS